MAKETLADFLIKIGVDSGKSLKEIDKIEARLKKLPTIQQKIARTSSNPTERSGGGSDPNYRKRMNAILNVQNMEKRAFQQTVSQTGKVINLSETLAKQKKAAHAAELANAKKRVKVMQRGYSAELAAFRAKLELFRKLDAAAESAKGENLANLRVLRQQVSAVAHKSSKFHALRDNIIRATSAQRELNRQFQFGRFAAQGMKDSMKNAARSYISIFAAIQGGRAVTQTATQFESLQNGLIAIEGSAEEAGKRFDTIKEQAKGLGTALKPAIEGYTKLSIAGKGTFNANEIKELNTAIMEGSVAFGLSAEESAGAVKALEQMMAKGKVTAEELRGQLAERMPVAIEAMARAAGVTKEVFAEMLDNGEVGIDTLKNFGKELRKISREGGLLEKQQGSLQAAQNRFTLAWQDAVVAFSESGFADGLRFFLNELSAGLESAKPLIQVLGRVTKVILATLGVAFRVVGETLGVIGIALTSLMDMLEEIGGWVIAVFGGIFVKIFGSKATKAMGKFADSLMDTSKGFKLVGTFARFGLAALLKFFNPITKIVGVGLLLIGIFDELFNVFRKNENKKVGMFSAPEGYKTGLEIIVEDLTKLFNSMWDNIFSHMVESFKAHMREIPVIGGLFEDRGNAQRYQSAMDRRDSRDYSSYSFGEIAQRSQGGRGANGPQVVTNDITVVAQTNASAEEIANQVNQQVRKFGRAYSPNY